MFKCLIFNISADGFRSLGAHRIANHLRNNNWNAEVIDFAGMWSTEELKLLVLSRIDKNTKFIGFSFLWSTWSQSLEQFCIWIKQNYPDIVIISGSADRPLINTNQIDYYIVGYGENAITELLSWLFGNGTRPRFELQKYNNGLIIQAIQNYPAFPLKNPMVRYEDRDFVQSDEWLSVEFSRGCRFKCAFCNFPVLGVKEDYSRDTENFFLQMQDAYDRFGVQNYLVTDDTFNDSTEKIIKFADVVESLSFVPFFTGFLRIDLLVTRPQDKIELARMNFLGHFYGVESFNHQSVKSIGKGMHPDKIKQGLIDVRSYLENSVKKQYRGTISLIVGLPGETEQSLNDSKNWLDENWQGQSFSCSPMFIPIGENVTQSLIGNNYAKYGYRPLNEKISGTYEPTENAIYQNQLIWENDNLNLYKSIDICNEFNEIKKGNFYEDNWSLGVLGLPSSVSERLKLKDREARNEHYTAIRKNLVANYIKKKLDL